MHEGNPGSNMVMYDAMRTLSLAPSEELIAADSTQWSAWLNSDEHIALWNEACDIARQNDYWGNLKA